MEGAIAFVKRPCKRESIFDKLYTEQERIEREVVKKFEISGTLINTTIVSSISAIIIAFSPILGIDSLSRLLPRPVTEVSVICKPALIVPHIFYKNPTHILLARQ
jgi:hypothetical protein